MKTIRQQNVILILLSAIFLCSCETNNRMQLHENTEQTIIDKETAALEYWAKGDPESFSNGYAEDATYFDDIGAQSRLNGLTEIKAHFASLEGQIPPHEFELVDPKVQVYGNVAILTFQYHATFNDTIKGQPWKATSVYSFKDNDWKVVHAHWSLIKEKE